MFITDPQVPVCSFEYRYWRLNLGFEMCPTHPYMCQCIDIPVFVSVHTFSTDTQFGHFDPPYRYRIPCIVLVILPSRRETCSSAGKATKGQTANACIVSNEHFLPPVPIPPVGRGEGGIPQAPQGAHIRDMALLI
ncbi:hypothetical protein V6N11_080573 [Hibiscus sabdariffa]|uniref:Uncharacterized protein n=1 Tax=Hibiscus sabdariffa TaxID=183260 RepID=A0ABR2R807_9ROSI